MLRIYPVYNNVKLDRINDLQQFASQQYLSSSITDKLRHQTEAYFNRFIDNWNQNPHRCIFSFQPSFEPTCLNRQVEIFSRNRVYINSVYTETILIVYRLPLSATA